MNRYRIFYYIELLSQGGDRLVLAESEAKAIEIFKDIISKEGKPDPKITEVRIL